MNHEIRQVLLEGLDRQVPAMRQTQTMVPAPSRGWLRAVREALGMTQRSVGAAMGIKQQGYRLVEGREARGAVTIDTLRRAADALDCELVYFLVPKQEAAPTFTSLASAHDHSHSNKRATEHSMKLEGQGKPVEIPPKPNQPTS
jgi:predicted DNA-binding mobile mystery protein A